jgi:hypothetical protein
VAMAPGHYPGERGVKLAHFDYTEHIACTPRTPSAKSLMAFPDDEGFPGFLEEQNPQIRQDLLGRSAYLWNDRSAAAKVG